MKVWTFLVFLTLSPKATPGENLYRLKCATCHGQNAEGLKDHLAPRIRGQFSWYIADELTHFANGERKDGPKRPHGTLSQKDLKDLATYLSELK